MQIAATRLNRSERVDCRGVWTIVQRHRLKGHTCTVQGTPPQFVREGDPPSKVKAAFPRARHCHSGRRKLLSFALASEYWTVPSNFRWPALVRVWLPAPACSQRTALRIC